jgi:hypothetical protein
MALYADRVKQSLGVTGTGTVTLTLATTGNGYQSFLTAFGTGTQTVAYCIADQSGPNWEVGTGSYNGSANTLARTTVLASSNGGSLTNFSGGTQDVFCTAPAKYLEPTVGVCWSLVGTTVVGDYTVLFKAPFAFTVNETSMVCVSGSATATVKINATNVTGGTAIGGGSQSVGTTTTTVARTSSNTVNAGDSIVVTFTAGAVNPSVTIKGTRT